jgi:hypothetical protein
MPPILPTLSQQYLAATAATTRAGTTIVKGREAPFVDEISLQGGSATRRNPAAPFAHAAGVTISFTEFLAFLQWVDESPADHQNIINDPRWIAVYHPVMFAWPTRNRAGHLGPVLPAELSVACRGCGIFLPMRAIQIDHVRPMAGSATEAIVKVFRHRDYTDGAAKGEKGQLFSGNATASTQDERYTLSTKGAIIYSLIHAGAHGEIGHLRASCRNNVANLRPMCVPCNNARNRGGIPSKY